MIKRKDRGFLRVIDGFRSDKSRNVFAAREFTTMLYEIQERREERIVSSEYADIPNKEEKMSMLEKMLRHYPDNLCIKLSAAIDYLESKEHKHLGLLVLREIEEAITMNPILLSDLHNEESSVERIVEDADNNLGNADLQLRRLNIAKHYLDLYRVISLKSNSQKLYDILIKSYAYVLLRDNDAALSLFRTIEEIHPDAIFIYNLYARRLEASNCHEEAGKKRALFSSWALHDSNTIFERVSNAMRSVYKLGNEAVPAVNKTLISIRTKNKDEISYEQGAILRAKRIVQDNYCYRIVESVHTECIDGVYYHVLRRKSGDVLLSFLENEYNKSQQLPVLSEIIRFLQLLQFNMGIVTKCNKKDCESLAASLSARLGGNKIRLSTEVNDSIAGLCESFLSVPIVYNKDSHPENWIIEKVYGTQEIYIITALDFQKKTSAPCVFDIANLLRYGNYISEKNESDLLREYYIRGCNNLSYLNDIDYQQFLNSYYAGVVYRMLSFFCAWQHPRKAGYYTRIPVVLNNAAAAIDKVEDKQFDKERLKELICSIR